MTVTKENIISEIYSQTELSRKDARQAVEKLMDIVKRSLAEEKDVLVSGFGKFMVRRKCARKGRNPKTNERLELKARRVVVFKNSGLLRRKINGEVADKFSSDEF